MKIIIFANNFWNIYNFRLPLINKIKSKHDLILIAPNDQYSKFFKEKGLTIKKIPFMPHTKSITSNFILFIKFFLYAREIKPDLIITYTIKCNLVGSICAFFLNTKSIINITGLGSGLINKNIFSKLLFLFYKFSLYFSNKVIFHNNSDRKLFLKKKIVKTEQSVVIPGLGIDLNRYQMKKIDEIKNFFYIGRLVKNKGIKEFLKLSKINNNLKKRINFGIIGKFYNQDPDTISKEYFKKFKNKYVKYYGFKTNILHYYKNVDCLILPSKREGVSKVLLEACALGIPIITTRNPGCRDLLIQGKNGFYCEFGNIISLEKALKKMINLKKKQIHNFSKFSRKLVEEKFDQAEIIKKYLKLIENI
jgi:glycosyltransferase involved in cell wall biosynthesis